MKKIFLLLPLMVILFASCTKDRSVEEVGQELNIVNITWTNRGEVKNDKNATKFYSLSFNNGDVVISTFLIKDKTGELSSDKMKLENVENDIYKIKGRIGEIYIKDKKDKNATTFNKKVATFKMINNELLVTGYFSSGTNVFLRTTPNDVAR